MKEQLKRLFSQERFGPEFIEAAKEELPLIWGRLSLLEEFYDLNAPGVGERSRMLNTQLRGDWNPRPRPGLFERLKGILLAGERAR